MSSSRIGGSPQWPSIPPSPRLFVLLKTALRRHSQASNTAHSVRAVHLPATATVNSQSKAMVDGAADAASASSPASLHPNIPQAPVEARSLSSITTIASNPPAYPRNPAQKKLDPLVLYIVRVPGSKGIFLCPHQSFNLQHLRRLTRLTLQMCSSRR